MSDITIYHNPRCGKSREALALLGEKGLFYTVRLYLTDPLSKAELTALLKKLGMRPSELVRKGEDIYKQQYKDKNVSEKEWLGILAQHPIFIERPIVEVGDKAIVARPAERIADIIGD